MEKLRRFFYRVMTDETRGVLVLPLKFVLWMLSLAYGLLLRIRDAFYNTGMLKLQTLPVKVIGVGNLTVGGTGKTPMAMELARLLEGCGRKVAVLLRGYGQDEYAMLSNSLKGIPVIKGKDRRRSGQEAIDRYNADALILDDSFQYRRLKKDFNILLIDSRNPFGNGHLLPRGILRDMVSNTKNADVIVLTKVSPGTSVILPIKERLSRIAPGVEIFSACHTPLRLYDIVKNEDVPLDFVKGKRIASLSSIGDPAYFNSLLEDLGAEKALEFSFLDHHNYNRKEIDRVVASCKKSNLDTIVTTEKDAAKLTAGLLIEVALRFLSLKIKMDLREDETRFTDRLHRICNS